MTSLDSVDSRGRSTAAEKPPRTEGSRACAGLKLRSIACIIPSLRREVDSQAKRPEEADR